MIVRRYFSRYGWLFFIAHKSDATETFETLWAYLRVEGNPFEVVVVRSSEGGEFNERNSECFAKKEI